METKVIIGILTYNLERYIAQALDSVLQQKTNFKYRILISDDGSTDSTMDILKKYQEKYSTKIEVMGAKVNGGCSVNALRIYERLDAPYFAILDGDDVWIGEHRLQQQVDFLDKHPSYMLCAGQTKIFSADVSGNMLIPGKWLGKEYTFADYFFNPLLLHVSGLLYRNEIFSKGVPQCFYNTLDTFEDCAVRGEDFRRMIHLELGPAYILPILVSGYRIHDKGLWSGMSNARKAIESAIGSTYYRKYYRGKHPAMKQAIEGVAVRAYQAMWETLINEKIIYPECRLDEKSMKLLTCFLCDISREKKIDSWGICANNSMEG